MSASAPFLGSAQARLIYYVLPSAKKLMIVYEARESTEAQRLIALEEGIPFVMSISNECTARLLSVFSVFAVGCCVMPWNNFDLTFSVYRYAIELLFEQTVGSCDCVICLIVWKRISLFSCFFDEYNFGEEHWTTTGRETNGIGSGIFRRIATVMILGGRFLISHTLGHGHRSFVKISGFTCNSCEESTMLARWVRSLKNRKNSS
jgi:hypothetical protein